MYRGTKRDHESGQFPVDTILYRLLQRHGNRRSRRLCSQGRHVSRQHIPEQPERILLRHDPGDKELDKQQNDRQEKYHHDDFHEYAQHTRNLSGILDVQEDAENVKRQQRNNHPRDHLVDNILEILHRSFQRGPVNH